MAVKIGGQPSLQSTVLACAKLTFFGVYPAKKVPSVLAFFVFGEGGYSPCNRPLARNDSFHVSYELHITCIQLQTIPTTIRFCFLDLRWVGENS